ncbi:Uu.00g130710.m01.CDS01 [Anthostomella pinea]|uniref:Uu.00g130710.m01.CDS01 n=1 Tax=Anthostomella pinea TaxID=933095 RepID=A0AAI8VDF3_9PEZI|nr:Uu.00g130710.m01.CDS01 [Anthostomella pinea]
MFLHSGASLHGHEYSRPPANAPNAGHRRNPLLRSAFATPISRPYTYHPDTRHSPCDGPAPSVKQPRRLSVDSHQTPEAVVRFKEPEGDVPASRLAAMSEDEVSIISDSDASRESSSVRRNRRRTPRQSTAYILAHPPPKLRTKQRIIHTRPTLLLQVQQVSAGQRPRPAIDVYPSSAITRSIIAPFLKRFPRLARIKTELSIQDIMLVRSEDYGTQSSESDSDNDEETMKSRDLIAILSPLRTEDKAEIVLADGTVWVATPRSHGKTCSYEFVSVDANGQTITARWVRKQIVSRSLPSTPTTTVPPVAKAQSADYKFTFSIIDPNCRRHPIMATLTNSSLDILDSYTTVSQSASRYPPPSTVLSPPSTPTGDQQAHMERRTQPVEEWQKSFIAISAIWVALRHGWAPNCRPTDVVSPAASVYPSTTDGSLPARSSSFGPIPESAPNSPNLDAVGRRKCPTAMRPPNDQPPKGALPRRATSTGAAFMQKRRAMQRESEDLPGGSELERTPKLGRRAFSGDWNVGTRKRTPENSLAGILDSNTEAIPKHTPTLAPAPLPTERRAVSAYFPPQPLSHNLGDDKFGQQVGLQSLPGVQQGRHQKWKNMANWFRRLGR